MPAARSRLRHRRRGRRRDYGDVAERALAVAQGGPYALLERLADAIAGELLDAFPLRRVTVRVHKPSAPVPAVLDDVSVSVTRTRD